MSRSTLRSDGAVPWACTPINSTAGAAAAMAAACKKFRLVIRFMFGISSMMECLLTEECKPFAATRLRIMRRECLKVSAIVGLGGGMRKCGPRSLGKDIMSGAL